MPTVPGKPETEPGREGLATRFAGDDRWELVQRVIASSHFQRAGRHRDFLTYVTGRVLTEPGMEIREHEIASKVFLRQTDGAKGEDTIVRVQAYQLRKRLQLYFSTEGKDEPLVVEIPKGSYAPVFRPRPAEEPAPAPDPFSLPPPQRRLVRLLAGTAAILAITCGWLLLRNSPPGKPLASTTPALNAFWSRFASKDRRIDVVIADSSLSLMADVLHRPIPLSEYLQRDYRKETDKLPGKPLQELARMLLSRQHTSIGDANVAGKISLLAGRQGVSAHLLYARDFHIRHLKTDNVVLLGSSRSNPWTELFEKQLNFRFAYDETTHSATIENRSPLPGEAALYRVQTGDGQMEVGFCRLALLPNSDRTGEVLLIAGTEMEGTEAGGEFLTSERGISQLRQLLRLNPTDRIPYFELLLRTTRIGGAAPSFEVLTYRLPGL